MNDRSQGLRRIAKIATLTTTITLVYTGLLGAQEVRRDQHHMNPRTSNVSPAPTTPTQHLAPLAVPTPALNPTTWTNIGPAPITADPTSESTPDVGRISGIAAHPTDANTIYVAANGGGVWKTSNGGTTWTPLTDTQKTLSMGSIAMAPSDSNVLYAGTGQMDGNGNANFGRGVLVSKDGGATWTLQNNGGIFDRHEVPEIAVDPQNSSVAYVAISSCCATNTLFDQKNGIYKTTDGGATWTNTTSTVSTDSWSSVRIDQSTTGTTAVLYAAVGDPSGLASNGVYKTTNGGTTWTKLTDAKLPSGTAAGRITVAVSKSDPATPPATGSTPNSKVVYVSASGNGKTGSTPDGSLYKFLRSDDGGATFTDLTAGTPNYMHTQGAFDTSLIVDPTNSAIVYAGGDSNPNGINRSTDKGVTWVDIGGVSNGVNGPHVDHHAAAFDANGKFLDGDDGGIFRLESVDLTMTPPSATWTALNNGNLSDVQLYSIGLNLGNVNSAIGGTQDNGLVSYSGNLSWSEVTCGDTGTVRISPTLTTRAYASCSGDSFFLRSDDTGATWTAKISGITDSSDHIFFPPFAVDPNDGNRVVWGGRHAWETTNAGDTWTQLGTGDPFGADIDALDLAADDPKVIYVSASGNLFVTTDKGTTWTMINLPVTGSYTVQSIRVFPKDHRKAVAAINSFTTGGNIFYTTDTGKTWTNIGTTSSGFPNLPVWSVTFHGDSINTIYAGADDGVYKTTDRGGSWFRFGSGLPNVQVFELQLDTATLGVLAAATFGRGAWEIKLPPATTTKVDKQQGKVGDTITLKATVKPNGVPGTVKFEVNGVPLTGSATYDSTTGVATQNYTIGLAEGTYPITADFTSSNETLGGNSGDVANLTVKK